MKAIQLEKVSLVVICKILGLFVNTMTADDKYYLLKGTIYCNILRYNYLRKKKFFSIFFFIFGIRSDFEDFPEKDLPHS